MRGLRKWIIPSQAIGQSQMFLAFDDTDSTKGMCTTYLATEMIRAVEGLDLIGLPRLVRLNPAVPWKTRGNGALCLRFGKGKGRRRLIGRIGRRPVYSFDRGDEPEESEELFSTGTELLRRWSRIEEEASPGLVMSRVRPSLAIYWQAVRRVIEKSMVEAELKRIGAKATGLCGGRGVIGATAAMSWVPHDRTYEVLAYRREDRWGTERIVSKEDAERLDERFPSTFNNYDHDLDAMAIAPHSPCPILLGIRGDVLEDLPLAMASIRSEPKDRWLLYLTNQGTDDHVIPAAGRIVPGSTYRMQGVVMATPKTLAGGHVLFQLSYKRTTVDVAAYEPSKGFRSKVRALRPGDVVQVIGELRETPRTLNLEKFELLEPAKVRRKVANPRCPACDKSMQSLGSDAGFRCRRCGRKEEQAKAEYENVGRDIEPGWYEPPVCTRRHLSKPLKRLPARHRC
ncbi:MAG: tRNA(Ile)(2)-agmatinylcytidine synthase [Methanomassiliicoccales archaeon]|nr:tRNA(Ile)(2)-agmatinylcytidine synthase [Methanomassiliicoccales archaeon]